MMIYGVKIESRFALPESDSLLEPDLDESMAVEISFTNDRAILLEMTIFESGEIASNDHAPIDSVLSSTHLLFEHTT